MSLRSQQVRRIPTNPSLSISSRYLASKETTGLKQLKKNMEASKLDALDFFGPAWDSEGGKLLEQFLNRGKTFNQTINTTQADADAGIFCYNMCISKDVFVVFTFRKINVPNVGDVYDFDYSAFFDANGFKNASDSAKLQLIIYLVEIGKKYTEYQKSTDEIKKLKGGKKSTRRNKKRGKYTKSKKGKKLRRTMKKRGGGITKTTMLLFLFITVLFNTCYGSTNIRGLKEVRHQCERDTPPTSWWDYLFNGVLPTSKLINECVKGELQIEFAVGEGARATASNNSILFITLAAIGSVCTISCVGAILNILTASFATRNTVNREKNKIEKEEVKLALGQKVLTFSENAKVRAQAEAEAAEGKGETVEYQIFETEYLKGQHEAEISELESQVEQLKAIRIHPNHPNHADQQKKEDMIREREEKIDAYKNEVRILDLNLARLNYELRKNKKGAVKAQNKIAGEETLITALRLTNKGYGNDIAAAEERIDTAVENGLIKGVNQIGTILSASQLAIGSVAAAYNANIAANAAAASARDAKVLEINLTSLERLEAAGIAQQNAFGSSVETVVSGLTSVGTVMAGADPGTAVAFGGFVGSCAGSAFKSSPSDRLLADGPSPQGAVRAPPLGIKPLPNVAIADLAKVGTTGAASFNAFLREMQKPGPVSPELPNISSETEETSNRVNARAGGAPARKGSLPPPTLTNPDATPEQLNAIIAQLNAQLKAQLAAQNPAAAAQNPAAAAQNPAAAEQNPAKTALTDAVRRNLADISI